MKILLLALALSTPSFAANLSGTWTSAEGKVSGALSGPCRLVELKIRQTATALVTEKYKADCQAYSTEWGPVTQEIRDGKVYEQGEEVGTFDGSTLRSSARDGSITYIFNLSLGTDANGRETLNSRYGVENFAGRIYTDAPMHRAQ